MPENNDRDDQNPQPNDDNSGRDDQSKYNPADMDEAMRIIKALEKRVGERDTSVSQLNERLSAMEQAQQARLQQNGQFEELAAQRAAEIETLRPYQQRAESLEAIIRQSNQQRIEQIPEGMRSIVPSEMLTPDQLATWLDKNASLLMRPNAPDLNGGAGSGGNPPPSVTLTADEKALAKQMGLSDEDYLNVKKRQQG